MAKTKVTIKSPDFSAFKRAVEDLTVKTGEAIVAKASINAPVDTGNYRSQIEYDGANMVIANANYSADIEYGTGAHEIRPQTAQALHFQKDGKDVFAKKVEHPGTRPNPVMRNAAKDVQAQIPQLWKEAQRENGIK